MAEWIQPCRADETIIAEGKRKERREVEKVKEVARENMNTIDFEKAFISLQTLVQPLKLGHKMRVVVDYDSTARHIKMNYLDINKDANPESLPDNVQFDYMRENGGISRAYGKLVTGSGGQNREYYESHMKDIFAMLGIKGLAEKVRVIVDYDPEKEKVSIRHFKPDEVEKKRVLTYKDGRPSFEDKEV